MPQMAERLIHILPEQVASQIAAGEVVERPASAIKEMVENSLDAGARAVAVAIERGGCVLMEVADDGSGMMREDAILAVRRHATSKIRYASDLAAVRTMGFRGEALAAIASVSRMRLKTRRQVDEHGVELDLVGGESEQTRAYAMAPGTLIEVRDLFFNTPARLKFMKTAPTEQAAVAETLQRLALAHPEVAFTLTADGRRMLELPRAASLFERARQLYGARLAEQMLGFDARHPGLRVHGLASMSQESFPTARMVLLFVNRRPVRDRMLQRAVAQAYQTLLPRGRHPAVVLLVELSAQEVDVNVHPMKTEVRFRNSGGLFEAVYRTLRDRLADQRDAAEPPHSAAQRAEAPPPATAGLARESGGALRLVADAAVSAGAGAVQRPLGLAYGRDAAAGVSAESASERADAGLTVARRAAAGTPPLRGVPDYSRLRIIGQLFSGYIALEGDDGLILVDQHAAHERVTFERLCAELRSGGVRVQAMLAPQTLELAPARAAQVRAAIPELRAMGFEVEPFGPATLVLKGAPAVFGPGGGLKLLADMLDSMGEAGFAMRGEEAFTGLLKQLACHGSVRVGRALSAGEIAQLLSDLDHTEFKTNCPHGRPVHISFPRGTIERMFRR